MKKMIKMSLVAAVAVAGLTSTASAKQNLAEWAQNTDLSGYVRYRLNTDHETANQGDMTEEAKAVMKFTTKVNDNVTANLKYVSFAETKSADTAADTAVKEANFVVKAGKATVIAGLQTSQSPFFANNGDTRSHGFTALVPVGPATIAAAYYTTTVGSGAMAKSSVIDAPTKNAIANNVLALGALTKFGNVNVNAWYAQVEDTSDVEDQTLSGVTVLSGAANLKDASAMSLEVSAKVGAINAQLMHTELEGNDVKGTLTKAVLSGKAGKVSYAAGYAQTGDEALGGQVTIDNDSDAKSDLSMHVLNMQATKDASAIYLMGGYKVNDQISASLSYLSGSDDMSAGTKNDFDEYNVQAGYQMSKNFAATVIYGAGEFQGADFAESRIEVKYTF